MTSPLTQGFTTALGAAVGAAGAYLTGGNPLAGGIAGAAFVNAGNILSQAMGLNTSAYQQNTVAQFPGDLINTASGRTFYMTLWFYQYQRPSVYVTPYLNPIGQIVLPIPVNLIDAQTENWTQQDNASSPAVGAALDAAAKSIATGATTIATLGNAGAAAIGAAGAQTASNLGNTIGSAVGITNGGAQALQLAGLAINPFLTVLFTSPVFKRYQFSWVFTPVNQQESDTLKFILNKLRYHQLPDAILGTTAGSLLQYPDICVPVINPTGYVYTFKRCVIEGSSVNYAPGSTPGFFNNSSPSVNGNAPVTVTLTLSLLEIEYGLKSTVFNTSDPNYSIPGDILPSQASNFGLNLTNPSLSSTPSPVFPNQYGSIGTF